MRTAALNRRNLESARKRLAASLLLAYLLCLLAVSFCFSAGFEAFRFEHPAPAFSPDLPATGPAGAVFPVEATAEPGDEFEAVVTFAPDGDSLIVEHDGKSFKIRLAEVDTPEYDQPYGDEAKDFTRARLTGRTVLIEVRAVDAYRRLVSVVRLPDGDTHNRALLRAGLAWWYRYYSDDRTLGELERRAREARLGLWADPNPVPPWTHRRDRRRRGLLPIDPLEI